MTETCSRANILMGGLLVCVALIASPAPEVHADENSVMSASVKSRSRPGIDPVGLRAGSFFINPYAKTGILFDDNVFAVDLNAEHDIIWTTDAGVEAQSNWGRHALNFDLNVKNYTHAEFTNENKTDFGGRMGSRLDVTRDVSISSNFSAERITEARGSAETPLAAAEPTQYTRLSGGVALNKNFNRLTVQLRGALTDIDYENVDSVGGGQINQDLRDGQIYTAGIRAEYAISPGYFAFVTADANKREFGDSNPLTNRDSEGIESRAGLGFEITRLIAGEISAGYLYQDYDSPAFDSTESVAAKVGLLWNPTMLMTVTLEGERTVRETVTSGASGRLDTSALARIDYEILRNLIGSASASYLHQDFQGIDREDDILEAGASLTYLINRNLAAEAYYSFITRDSSEGGLDYDRNKVGGTVRAKF